MMFIAGQICASILVAESISAAPIHADWSLDNSGDAGQGTFSNVGGVPDFEFVITGDFDPTKSAVREDFYRNTVWDHLFGSGHKQESLGFGKDPSSDLKISVMTIRFDSPVEGSMLAIALTDLEGEDAILGASLGGVAIPTAQVAGWFQGLFDSRGGLNFPSGFDTQHAALVAQMDPDGLLSDESLGYLNPNTESASGWFIPNQPIDQLTITYRDRSGGPASIRVYMAVAEEPIVNPPSLREFLKPIAVSNGPLYEPTVVDFGALTGEITYEFFLKPTKTASRATLAGDGQWSIGLDSSTKKVGLFGPDGFEALFPGSGNRFEYGKDIHIIIGSYLSPHPNARPNATLYINGEAGRSVFDPRLAHVSGMVSLMASGPNFLFPMKSGSILHGWAVYDVPVWAAERAALSREPFRYERPEIADLPKILKISRSTEGSIGLEIFGAGEDSQPNLEYSTDLESWKRIATGVATFFEDTDPARVGRSAGYYRLTDGAEQIR